MLYIYLAIVLFLLVFIVWNMIQEKNVQIDAALVVVPLVLRLLLIK